MYGNKKYLKYYTGKMSRSATRKNKKAMRGKYYNGSL
jgi:hypothetical protein